MDSDQQENKVEEKVFAGGGSSSHQPRYELILLSGLTALAKRMEYGLARKGPASVNVYNTAPAYDKDFIINRLAHNIKHSYDAIKKVALGHPLTKEEGENGGDAGAIMFAGMLLAEHLDGIFYTSTTQPPTEETKVDCGIKLPTHIPYTHTVITDYNGEDVRIGLGCSKPSKNGYLCGRYTHHDGECEFTVKKK